ncbi:phosphodiester glycosidase family protein [Verrucomicrobium sp. BvORR106]|uniref:phosphodiester glycosidase family protein n=1 Tax=Verrucomicrobium sp. BvORR106 TaxID=1403819 RepID=UPI00056E4338|nr:phosphodiester glycosidase family protein [Verrucomicrobium sp. BvORR106]
MRSGGKPLKKKRGCAWRILGLLMVLGLVAVLAVDYVFNLRSTMVFLAFRDSRAPLEVRLGGGSWKPVSALTVAEMDRALVRRDEDTGITWRTLVLRREARTWGQRLAGFLVRETVNVIEINPASYQFQTSFKDGFALTTAKERLDTERASFAITANFRDPAGKPLGLVVHEGTQRNSTFPAWTGYFFVKAGKPWFGPKSLFEEAPGVLQEASQGYPSLMKNHTVFSYVDLPSTRYFDGNRVTYRALAGMKQNGNIVFILSGTGGVMNVSEVTALAQRLNVQHATLLDGGRALQYSLRLHGAARHFTAFNTLIDFGSQMLELQRSPVYIVARPAAAANNATVTAP